MSWFRPFQWKSLIVKGKRGLGIEREIELVLTSFVRPRISPCILHGSLKRTENPPRGDGQATYVGRGVAAVTSGWSRLANHQAFSRRTCSCAVAVKRTRRFFSAIEV